MSNKRSLSVAGQLQLLDPGEIDGWAPVPDPCWVAGVDEVGRGALFGPVVAAAVLLSPPALSPLAAAGVTDSKRLSARQRQQLVPTIQALAVDCQIGVASVAEIDRHNILQAALLAMRRAVQKLSPQPDLCLVDGNQPIPHLGLPQQTVVKGDQRVLAIACASIIAKVWRDNLIARLAQTYPHYDLIANKGYGSQRHRAALQTWGVTPLHRRSFGPCQIHPEG
ncbi:ribonuclease HII [Trichothermofontia sichuanensis B231]|uniref:ribonuclease HII n=1 Tax=Trichothermofontia sichuanensis TaxID=3045816 RepID=UPI0022465176|nr:ribonuclease HII [Trichothermofontia sichuanensis]UZQ55716.1 ribonuclease HII [Trichothermofontia sichuanensis B231]